MSNISALSCAEVRELAPELALGILSGAERAEVLLHVNGCSRCQAYVAELTEAADVLPQLAPEAEPPTGFEARVLHRLGDARAPHPSTVDRGRGRRRRGGDHRERHCGAGRRVDDSEPVALPLPTTAVTGTPVAVPMEGGALDLAAGWAYVSDHHGVAVAVNYGLESGMYTVAVTPPHGATTPIGAVQVTDGHGSWTGRSDDALRAGSRIALVDAAGTEMCHGTVPVAG